jgi:hypothetical protein
VGRLGRAISPRKPHWVAAVLFEMYMDETGTHESAPVVGAAAYLARSEQWEAFTAAWTGVLHVGGGSIRTDEPGLSSVSREGGEEWTARRPFRCAGAGFLGG